MPNGVRAPAAAPPRPAAPHEGDRTGPTVLLAEDDHSVRRVVARVLRNAGYRVLEAGDGRDALALWQAHAEAVDALLADVRMPHLRGDVLARVLVGERPSLPVVLMTGFADEPVALSPDGAGRDGGVLTPLAKPFSALELLARLGSALGAGAAAPRA